jgi:hypothetical protein
MGRSSVKVNQPGGRPVLRPFNLDESDDPVFSAEDEIDFPTVPGPDIAEGNIFARRILKLGLFSKTLHKSQDNYANQLCKSMPFGMVVPGLDGSCRMDSLKRRRRSLYDSFDTCNLSDYNVV